MLAIMVAAEDARVHSQLANTSKMRIILDKFPVFVLGFLAVVLLNTFGFMSKEEAKMASNFMNWCFLLGFSSIGPTSATSRPRAFPARSSASVWPRSRPAWPCWWSSASCSRGPRRRGRDAPGAPCPGMEPSPHGGHLPIPHVP